MTISSASKSRAYGVLLVIQTLAALIILLSIIPIYGAILGAAGHQLLNLPQSPLLLIAAVVLFHCAYWFRLWRVPVAVSGHSLVLSHIAAFLGRLTFIFGTAFFALVIFRHLPSMVEVPDPLRLVARVSAVLFILFSLHCYSSELDRLGVALRPPTHR